MGKHVDTTRPEDNNSRSVNATTDWVDGRGEHRKPGPTVPLGSDLFRDPWSGNPDTDKAWAK